MAQYSINSYAADKNEAAEIAKENGFENNVTRFFDNPYCLCDCGESPAELFSNSKDEIFTVCICENCKENE